MLDWLITLLIVVVLLIWVLDYLDMLEPVTAILRLIGVVITGVAVLATFLLRKLITAGSLSPDRDCPRPRSSGSARPGYRGRPGGSRRPLSD